MHNYDERGTFKIYVVLFLGKLIFKGVQGHSYASIKIYLKHWRGSTQHETLLVVSPGSLYMNTSIENIIICVRRVY